MGSNFSRQMCCVACGRCMKQEAEEGAEETSETKPILQVPGETSTCINRQPPTRVLEASQRGPAELQSRCQDLRLQPGSAADGRDTCLDSEPGGLTEAQKAAWDSADFLMASAVMETKEEAAVLTQLQNLWEMEEAGNTEERKSVPHASDAQLLVHTAQDVRLTADMAQAEQGREDALHAETSLQGADVLQLMQTPGETAASPSREIQPPAEPGERLVGRSLSPGAVLVLEETGTFPHAEHLQETDVAKSAETRSQFIEEVKLMCPSETALPSAVEATRDTKETVDPLEVLPNDKAGEQLTCVDSFESLYLGEKSPEAASQLLGVLWQEALPSVLTAEKGQGPCCTEAAELGEPFCPWGDRDTVPGDLMEDEEVRERDPKTAADEAEQQQIVMQQVMDETLPFTEMSVEAAESLNVAPLLSEVLGVEEK